MNDFIFIEQLSVDTIIGILPHERKTKQTLLIDFEIFVDMQTAASTDNINETVNYYALSENIKQFVENSEFSLVETLAEHIANIALADIRIFAIKLKISKPAAIFYAKNVGVCIYREKKAINSDLHQ